MNKFNKVEVLGMDNLKSLCIKRNWYTCGNNEEYDALLNMAEATPTTEAIYNMAMDIIEHSNNLVLSDEDIAHVMTEIAGVCMVYYEIPEDDNTEITDEVEPITVDNLYEALTEIEANRDACIFTDGSALTTWMCGKFMYYEDENVGFGCGEELNDAEAFEIYSSKTRADEI